jgi:anti-sigma-K factor RskA
MKLRNPELVELLAQRYVLGTMRGAARRRMDSLIRVRSDVLTAVRLWERRLAPLAWSLEPVQPSELLWQRICREIGIGKSAPQSAVPWAAMAAAFGIVALISAGGWWNAARRPPEIVTETIIERVPAEVAVAVVSDELCCARSWSGGHENEQGRNTIGRIPDRVYA